MTDILNHGFMWKQIELLENHAHFFSDLVDIDFLIGDLLIVTTMDPFVGFSNKFRQRRNVLFPDPDGPIITITSPSWIVQLMSFKTS
ncbi:hypothetical protein NBRC111894_4716 [Sporolactobacillus inulinus]|uniref:Uncharacterized protein n=1 Tax=Sporolactobacillus inulinus TaxID=2078 RepID=A0A4Y1ZIX5_9BACL|nr:hypothetical protein NBRC111894_4716 [Sporolactobacillus inulinus]